MNRSRRNAGQRAGRGQQPILLALCLLLLALPSWLRGADPAVPAGATIPVSAMAVPGPASPASTFRGEPLISADIQLKGNRAQSWDQGSARMLLLEGDVRVGAGVYGFRAQRAVVRLDEVQEIGRTIRYLLIYLEDARPLHGRGAVIAQAPRLLVTVATIGNLKLSTNLLRPLVPGGPFITEASGRFDRYLDSLGGKYLAMPGAAEGPTLAQQMEELRAARRRQIDQETTQELEKGTAGHQISVAVTEPVAATQPDAPAAGLFPPAAVPPKPSPVQKILPADGAISFHADRIVIQSQGPDEKAVVLAGKVSVVYQGMESKRAMSLTADNAVLFLAGGELTGLAEGKAAADQVRGVYLEDNAVATDGSYTVRAPRVYYDLTSNKALLLDAVLFAWDVKRQIPLYLRAEQLRQETRTSFSARNAILTTSEFAEPHFSIGANRLTIQQERAGDASTWAFKAEGVKPKIGSKPIFWWPSVAGQGADTPLRDVRVETRSQRGHTFLDVTTKWDVFSLLGKRKPAGVDVTANLDYLGDHNLGLGTTIDYNRPGMFGKLDAYALPYDTGSDRLANRTDVDFNGDARGYALWRHRQQLPGNWEASVEVAYLSDATFLEEFFPNKTTDKPWETSVYLKKQEEDWAFTFLTSYDLSNVTAQTTTVQAPGYTTDKVPELGYYRVGTSLWDNRLTYFGENRISRVRIRPGEDSPADRGFSNAQSALLFGIPVATTDFADAFAAAGFPVDWRNRFDSRHELDVPLKFGPIDAVPYVVGRFTGYDDDFQGFAGEDEQFRLFAQAGLRLHTQVSRNYDNVSSRILDLHRIRHLIEPSADFSLSVSNVNPEDFPVFDPEVEGITEGGAFRVGLRNTFQTQRGGPGRWRSVDWMVLNTDFIHRSDDADIATPIAHFFGYRPEYSLGGDHFHTDLAWMVTDALAVVGEANYNLESERMSTWRIGASLHHSTRLTSHVEYRDIDIFDSRLLTYGLTYRITPKWEFGFEHTLSLSGPDRREVRLTMVRRLPQFRLVIFVSDDQVDDRQSVGVMLIPEGMSNDGELGRLGAGFIE